MIKIPLSHAVETGAWHHCHLNGDYFVIGTEGSIDFRIRVVSFEKIDISVIDEPNKIDLQFELGKLWLLEADVVNLTKKEIGSYPIHASLALFDQEGFEFTPVTDDHLTRESKYCKSKGLNLMNGSSGYNCGIFRPKIPVHGSLVFLLPDEDDALYSLSVRNGSIKEI